MKHLIFAILATIYFACSAVDNGMDPIIDPIDSITAPVPLGYSLGLGGQGVFIGTSEATEILVGDLAGADSSMSGILIFDTSDVISVFIPDSLRIIYWDNLSFMTAVALRAQGSGFPRQRMAVTLPDYRLEVVGDSCLTWNQSTFTDSIPCIPILAIQ